MSASFSSPAASTPVAIAERAYLRQVFAWMFLALALTTGVAVYLHASGSALPYFSDHPGVYFLLFAAQLGLVFGLAFALPKISAGTAALLFCLYAGLTGVTFSVLLDIYTSASVIGAFAGAAGVFAGMATYGYVTERDLSGLRGILFGALIGIIVASIAFAFVGGSTLNLIIGWAGVIIFSGLTAYDMQKIKEQGAQGIQDGEVAQKLAIFGALRLYLDFINLAISLLRIFGGRR